MQEGTILYRKLQKPCVNAKGAIAKYTVYSFYQVAYNDARYKRLGLFACAHDGAYRMGAKCEWLRPAELAADGYTPVTPEIQREYIDHCRKGAQACEREHFATALGYDTKKRQHQKQSIKL